MHPYCFQEFEICDLFKVYHKLSFSLLLLVAIPCRSFGLHTFWLHCLYLFTIISEFNMYGKGSMKVERFSHEGSKVRKRSLLQHQLFYSISAGTYDSLHICILLCSTETATSVSFLTSYV